jgi:hypothetical protein
VLGLLFAEHFPASQVVRDNTPPVWSVTISTLATPCSEYPFGGEVILGEKSQGGRCARQRTLKTGRLIDDAYVFDLN